MHGRLEDMLTDAQVAARLKLEIRQFQSALRRGLIPPPRLVAGKRRWTMGAGSHSNRRGARERP